MEHWVFQIANMTVNMDTLLTMWAAMGFLIIFAFISTRRLSVIPSKLQAFCETVLGFFWNLTDSMIGKDEGRKHIPLVASLFLFIVTANLMGQLPLRLIELKHGELASPTNDINMTAAMAIIVLIYYVFYGVKKKGVKFFLHSFSISDIITALIDLLEMVVRPFTLALRLYANILAGEILIAAFIGILAVVLPLPIMLFEVFVVK